MNRGIIEISQELLLNFLQFEGGHIQGAEVNPDVNTVKLYLQHPDLPEVLEGAVSPVVFPSYMNNYDTKGNLLSIERTAPPKR